MQTAQRNILLAGLAAASGSLDVWSYFGLAHIFVANMTGNTVLLGFSLAATQWAAAAGNAAAILSYICGVVLGTFLAEPIRQAVHGVRLDCNSAPWPARLQAVLCMELTLLSAAVSLELLRTPAMEGVSAHVLVCLAAAAVGVQSAAMVALEVPGVVTTYITGTWTTLAAGVARLLRRPHAAPANEAQLGLQAVVLTIYLLAAAGSGLLYRAGGRRWMGLLPFTLLLGVLAAGFFWQRRETTSA